MRFTSAASAFVLATAAFASPLSLNERLANAGVKRNVRRQGAMNIPHVSTNPKSDASAAVQQSSNWAGAALTTTGVTEITGTFTIPKPTVPSGGKATTEFGGAAWVGIDGDTCQTGLIQTGVFWFIEDGEIQYEAWYEYIPAASIAYTGITVTAGNEIKVTVTKTNANSGVTTLENVSTGETASHTFTNDEQGTLCGENAEWIVEDFTEGNSLIPFADFGTVTFTGASALVNGVTTTPAGADTIVLVSSSDASLTSTTVSGTTVTVKYE